MSYRFPVSARLRKRFEFTNVYKVGCKINTPHFLLLKSMNSLEQSRLGVTVSRKVGNAVVRNRVKRIIREYFRQNSFRFSSPADLSVIAKRCAGEASTAILWKELDLLFR